MPDTKISYPNILITGASSSIGYMVAKQIQQYKGIGTLYIGNSDAKFPAYVLSDYQLITPKLFEENFLNFLCKSIEEYKIDLLMPCSLGQIKFLAKYEKKIHDLGCRLLTEDPAIVSIFYDKLSTIQYLQQKGIPVLETSEISEVEGKSKFPNVSYPFFIKPRFGSGSKGIMVIHNDSEFLNWDSTQSHKFSPYIAQEYLDDALEEYSCSCTFGRDGSVKDIMAIRRKAVISVTTEAVYNPKCKIMEDSIRAIASKLRGKYVLNFQFKVKHDVPYIFEINPRLGSAEAIRIQFGMDALYSILSEYCEVEREVQTRRYGTVWRVYEEIFIPG